MNLLKNTVAVITGAGRGIGKAIAFELAKQGAKTAIISRQFQNAVDVSQEIEKNFPESSRPYALDVSNFSATEIVVQQILNDFQKVDILVNNAGITADNLLIRMSEKGWDDVMNTNIKGVFNVTKLFLPSMIKQKSGKIINISSISAVLGTAGQTNYAASKAAVIGFSKSLAREVASRNITVNVILPGFIDTDMTSVLSPQYREKILPQIPLNRFGKPEDIATAVTFLAGNTGSYITGQLLTIDGGLAI